SRFPGFLDTVIAFAVHMPQVESTLALLSELE
ncbi:MAG: hypothetical protein JWQ22_190, partial [Devosia sp.]|nr:hypothetical protein [Devosia sp.]